MYFTSQCFLIFRLFFFGCKEGRGGEWEIQKAAVSSPCYSFVCLKRIALYQAVSLVLSFRHFFVCSFSSERIHERIRERVVKVGMNLLQCIPVIL